MKPLLYSLTFIVLLSSCVSYNHIAISQDEIVTITRTIGIEDTIQDFNTEEIVDTINIDSLNQYLKVKGEQCYNIQYNSDSLELKICDSLPADIYSYIPNAVSLKFLNKIIDISGDGKVHLHRNNKELLIKKSRNNYFNSDEKVNVTVLFGEDSIHSKVKHPIALKRWGATMDNLPGFGFAQINNEASKYLRGSLFMNWSFAMVLNRLRLATRLAILDGTVTKPIKELESYDSFSNTNLELGFGYELLNQTYFNFTPIIYGGRNNLEFYSDKEESTEGKFLNGGFNYSIGASLDLKIDPIFRSKEKRKELKDIYFYLKIDAGWYPNYFQKSVSMDGSVSYLTFAISWYLVGDNNFRRVKWKND